MAAASAFARKSYWYQKLDDKTAIHVLKLHEGSSSLFVSRLNLWLDSPLSISGSPNFMKTCELAAVWSTLTPAAVEGISLVLNTLHNGVPWTCQKNGDLSSQVHTSTGNCMLNS